MRWLLLISLFLANAARAVTGDIVSFTVLSNGWDAQVVIAGLSTGGTYNFGFSGIPGTPFATNCITGAENVILTVARPGYDQTGAAVTNNWTVYGTHQVRQPATNTLDESSAGGNVTVHIALSEHIGPLDTVTAKIASGFYTQGGTPNNAASTLICVNNDTLAYPKVIANWQWPGFERMTRTNWTVRVGAFHQGAHQGMPVACVKVKWTDEHSHTATKTLTKMGVDAKMFPGIDTCPVIEYFGDIDLTTATDGDRIRLDYIAYPWYGTATEVYDTTANVYSMPTPYGASITNRYDLSGSFGGTYAVWDPVNGSDTTGRAICTNSDPTAIPVSLRCATFSKCATLIAATNGVSKGHTDTEASYVYLNGAGGYCISSAGTLGARPYSWLTITNYPGQQGSITNNAAGSSSQPVLVKFDGLLITPTNGNWISTSNNNWFGNWFNNCTIATTNSAQMSVGGSVNGTCLTYMTDNTITDWGQGFRPEAAANHVFALLRGNNLKYWGTKRGSTVPAIGAQVCVGNSHPDTNGCDWDIALDSAGQACPVSDWFIYVNNDFRGCRFQSQSHLVFNNSITNGGIFAQNNWESDTNNGQANFDFCGFSTPGQGHTNVMIWGNSVTGTKTFVCYNWASSGAGTNSVEWDVQISLKNNIFSDFNLKIDVDGGTTNANRVGNWSVLYGTGCSGNVWLEQGEGGASALGSPGNFLQEFCGLNTLSTNVPSGQNGWTNAVNFAQWFDYEAYQGITGAPNPSPGGGNYRLLTSSPLHNLKQEVLLPFGLNGQPRGTGVPNTACFDPPGPYAVGGPRKGGFFL